MQVCKRRNELRDYKQESVQEARELRLNAFFADDRRSFRNGIRSGARQERIFDAYLPNLFLYQFSNSRDNTLYINRNIERPQQLHG